MKIMSHGVECKIEQTKKQGSKLYYDKKKPNGATQRIKDEKLGVWFGTYPGFC